MDNAFCFTTQELEEKFYINPEVIVEECREGNLFNVISNGELYVYCNPEVLRVLISLSMMKLLREQKVREIING